MDRPQIVEWAVPTELAPRLFEQLWALPTLLKIAVTGNLKLLKRFFEAAV
ncbi:MAG: hypothetical protein H7Z11_23650 [Verrucomicrobia bacterium]|nr:hypothetical protein [Leptolyngbya sp. ES-bin-22]